MHGFGSHLARQCGSRTASVSGGVQMPVVSGYQQNSQAPYVKQKTEPSSSSCRVTAGRNRRGQRGHEAVIHWQWQKSFMPMVPLPMPQYSLYDIIFNGRDTPRLLFIVFQNS
ncbi:hypothetical protein DPMN_078357 [Dreissena polymorpha]|uniref:Uncharacterized protein n=1 Tax=Dreissena polymorpha TaxID=45954 RepID=A0A9D4BQ56_DREPO|nr:hypothetical protein DPMN_078357 [Dreissena polymorpha]